MWRQARTAFDRGQVPLLVITRRDLGKSAESHLRARFARRPFAFEPSRPIGPGRQQFPIVQPVRGGPAVGRIEAFGRIQGGRRRHMIAQRAPEGGVDFIETAAAGLHRARRREVIAVVTSKIEPLRDRALSIAPPWLVMTEAMDGAGPALLGNLRQFLFAFAAPQDQPRAARAQVFVEPREAVMQPPARRAAHRAVPRRFVVENIDGNDRTRRRRSDKRRLIGEPQIAAKPQDRRRRHQG